MVNDAAKINFSFFPKSATFLASLEQILSILTSMPDRTGNSQVDSSEALAGLLFKVGRGDDSAFRELVFQWEKPLLAFFYRQTRDFHESQDLAQDVFRRIYRSAGGFRKDGSARAWLFCIARRVLLNHWRTRQRKGLALPGDEFLQEAIPVDDSVNGNVKEEEEIFSQCLSRLSEKQRTVLLLRVREEMDYESIAEVLGESLANTKVLLHRARTRLKEVYQQERQL